MLALLRQEDKSLIEGSDSAPMPPLLDAAIQSGPREVPVAKTFGGRFNPSDCAKLKLDGVVL